MQETFRLNLSYHSFTFRSKRLSRIGSRSGLAAPGIEDNDSARKEIAFLGNIRNNRRYETAPLDWVTPAGRILPAAP